MHQERGPCTVPAPCGCAEKRPPWPKHSCHGKQGPWPGSPRRAATTEHPSSASRERGWRDSSKSGNSYEVFTFLTKGGGEQAK